MSKVSSGDSKSVDEVVISKEVGFGLLRARACGNITARVGNG
jgi:hypothetical protein